MLNLPFLKVLYGKCSPGIKADVFSHFDIIPSAYFPPASFSFTPPNGSPQTPHFPSLLVKA